MLKSRFNMRIAGLAAMLFLGLAIVVAVYVRSIPIDVILPAHQCKIAHSSVQDRITCWHNIIAREMARSGIPAAISAFTQIYRTFPEFADSGCHFQAHQVGDLAYYSYFVAEGLALSDIEFPESTASCGNGFFHGFLEHLIESKPTAEAIYSECEELIAKQEHVNPRIRIACYHASGHGLARAELDYTYGKPITDVQAFVARPLAECERITETKFIERRNCSQGVLNVVVNWMSLEKYGLSISREKPFGVCSELFRGSTYYDQCLVEISRKIDGLSSQNPDVILSFLDTLSISEELRKELLRTAITGVIQHMVGDGDPLEVFKQCNHFTEKDRGACQAGIVTGLILNGSPRSEMRSVTKFCRADMVFLHGDPSECWRTAGGVLAEFYSLEALRNMCRDLSKRECSLFLREA